MVSAQSSGFNVTGIIRLLRGLVEREPPLEREERAAFLRLSRKGCFKKDPYIS